MYSFALLTARPVNSETHENWIQPHLENLMLRKHWYLKKKKKVFSKM